MDNPDVKDLLRFLNIPIEIDRSISENMSIADEVNYTRDNAISHLMNHTLQCLGAIRQLVVESEKIRLEHNSTVIEESEIKSGTAELIQRQVFCQAVKTMTSTIITARDVDVYDPMKSLIESFPWSHNMNNNQWQMLNWAIMEVPPHKGDSEEKKEAQDDYIYLIRNILRYYPNTISEVDKSGHHYVTYVIRSQSVDLLEEVIHFHKNCVRIRDGKGKLAIHYAAYWSQRVEVLLILAEAMGRSLSDITTNCVDDFGNLPLHLAASGVSSDEILQEILFCFPDAVKIENNDGQLPLMMSVEGNNVEKVKKLFSAFPNAISLPDKRGFIPLFYAALNSKSVEIVEFLYQCYPEAIKIPLNQNGRLPIHYAAVKCNSSKIMEFLLEKYHKGSSFMDKHKRLPLHNIIARCEYMTPTRLRCLRLLLDHYPQGASLPDQSGQTPLDLAKRDGHGPLVLRLLLRADPSQDPEALGEISYVAAKAKYRNTNRDIR